MGYKSLAELKEGEIFLRWTANRLFKRSQNVIAVTTGSTGSGKSMQDLRRMELHYLEYFSKKFPDINKRIMENVFFSIGSLVNRLADKNNPLLPGEIIMLEEAGIGLSSHAWQDKSVKLFNHILQSFRCKGTMLIMNLPVFTMLNKSARQLCHWQFTMVNIDYKKKVSVSKGKYLQLSQQSGEHYPKYLRVVIDHAWTPIERYSYQLPSRELIDAYDEMKQSFVDKTIMSLKTHEDEATEKAEIKAGGSFKPFTERQLLIQKIYHEGIKTQTAIADKIGTKQDRISTNMISMTKKNPKWREIP